MSHVANDKIVDDIRDSTSILDDIEDLGLLMQIHNVLCDRSLSLKEADDKIKKLKAMYIGEPA